jgi:hypothetical protein
MKIITCKDLGITGTDADLVMSDEKFMSLCQSGDADGAHIRGFELLNPADNRSDEMRSLQLGELDKMEGENISLAFHEGKKIVISRAEWQELLSSNGNNKCKAQSSALYRHGKTQWK